MDHDHQRERDAWHGLKASDINWNMTATESNGIITVEGTAGNDCYTPQYGEKTLYACTSTAEDCSKDDRASTIIKFHNSGGASSDMFHAYARKMETISNIKPVLNSDGANNGCAADITNNSNCCSLPVVVAYKGKTYSKDTGTVIKPRPRTTGSGRMI